MTYREVNAICEETTQQYGKDFSTACRHCPIKDGCDNLVKAFANALSEVMYKSDTSAHNKDMGD